MTQSSVVNIINRLVSLSNEPEVVSFHSSVKLRLSELRDVNVTISSSDNLSENCVDVLNNKVQHAERARDHVEGVLQPKGRDDIDQYDELYEECSSEEGDRARDHVEGVLLPKERPDIDQNEEMYEVERAGGMIEARRGHKGRRR